MGAQGWAAGFGVVTRRVGGHAPGGHVGAVKKTPGEGVSTGSRSQSHQGRGYIRLETADDWLPQVLGGRRVRGKRRADGRRSGVPEEARRRRHEGARLRQGPRRLLDRDRQARPGGEVLIKRSEERKKTLPWRGIGGLRFFCKHRAGQPWGQGPRGCSVRQPKA
eukprot:79652-Prorocentrum_minimum.AAC.2